VFNWKFNNLKELDKEIRNHASNQQPMMTVIIMNQGNQKGKKKQIKEKTNKTPSSFYLLVKTTYLVISWTRNLFFFKKKIEKLVNWLY